MKAHRLPMYASWYDDELNIKNPRKCLEFDIRGIRRRLFHESKVLSEGASEIEPIWTFTVPLSFISGAMSPHVLNGLGPENPGMSVTVVLEPFKSLAHSVEQT